MVLSANWTFAIISKTYQIVGLSFCMFKTRQIGAPQVPAMTWDEWEALSWEVKYWVTFKALLEAQSEAKVPAPIGFICQRCTDNGNKNRQGRAVPNRMLGRFIKQP